MVAIATDSGKQNGLYRDHESVKGNTITYNNYVRQDNVASYRPVNMPMSTIRKFFLFL